jgi:hypothetical protein
MPVSGGKFNKSYPEYLTFQLVKQKSFPIVACKA